MIAVELPRHLYGYVRRSFLSNNERTGFEPAVWFALTCPKNRAFGLTVLLQCGALYRELPPHAFSFTQTAAPCTIQSAQAYDCFGGDAQAIAYDYLRDVPVTLKTGETGEYVVSVEFFNNGFSDYPAESKTLHGLRLDDGRLTFQPGNHFTVYDSSFTDLRGDVSWLRRQTDVWGVESYPEVTR